MQAGAHPQGRRLRIRSEPERPPGLIQAPFHRATGAQLLRVAVGQSGETVAPPTHLRRIDRDAEPRQVHASGPIGLFDVRAAHHLFAGIGAPMDSIEPVGATGTPDRSARRDNVLGTVEFNVNSGQSEIKGVELNAVARPVPWLELRAGYALQQTKIINFVNDDQADLYITAADIAALNAAAPPAAATATPAQRDAALAARLAAANALISQRGNAAGNELPRTPKHQVQLGAAVFHALSNGTKLSFRADYSWEAKRFIQVDNLGWSKPTSLLNLRTTAEFGKVTVALWMKNALDDDSPVDVLRSIDTQQTIGRPRTRVFGTGTGVLTETGNIRDFLVTMPQKRTTGVTLSMVF